jgi:hypothetical protein
MIQVKGGKVPIFYFQSKVCFAPIHLGQLVATDLILFCTFQIYSERQEEEKQEEGEETG